MKIKSFSKPSYLHYGMLALCAKSASLAATKEYACILCINSSPQSHLPVTQAHVMRLGISRNVSCVVGDCIGILREMQLVDVHACRHTQ